MNYQIDKFELYCDTSEPLCPKTAREHFRRLERLNLLAILIPKQPFYDANLDPEHIGYKTLGKVPSLWEDTILFKSSICQHLASFRSPKSRRVPPGYRSFDPPLDVHFSSILSLSCRHFALRVLPVTEHMPSQAELDIFVLSKSSM